MIRDFTTNITDTLPSNATEFKTTPESSKRKGFQGGFTGTFSRRLSHHKETTEVGYESRELLDKCVVGEGEVCFHLYFVVSQVTERVTRTQRVRC